MESTGIRSISRHDFGTQSFKIHTINEHDILASKLQRHRVQLSPHILPPHGLPGHDESPPNVSVLDKPFSVGDPHVLRQLKRGDSRSIRNGDDHVNLDPLGGQDLSGLLGQGVSHSHSASIDTDTIHRAIRTSKVDVFKDVRGESGRFGNGPLGKPISSDDDSFTRLNVLPVGEPNSISYNRFRGHQVVNSGGLGRRLTSSHTKGPDSVRVSETDETEPGEHTDTGVGALAGLHEVTDRSENVLLVDSKRDEVRLQYIGKGHKTDGQRLTGTSLSSASC